MKHSVLFLFVLATLSTTAQIIKGKLVDDNGAPVIFAALSLNNPKDSTLIKATISAEMGEFHFDDILQGEYALKITNIGYADYHKRLNYQGGVLDLGTIYLNAQAENLEEVTVTQEKPMVQVMADKTVFNVANTINATGTSAFELLRKAPGVIIDNNGGIIVEGKTGVQIFIDVGFYFI